jgi:microcystin-dependent protein
MEPFLGQLMIVGFNYAPRGWALCDGQLLPIAQNTALFSLLGTTFGGDGRTTFALPELRGRVSAHPGNGPGLPAMQWGQRGGSDTNTPDVAHTPAHTHGQTHAHVMQAVEVGGTLADPKDNILAKDGAGGSLTYHNGVNVAKVAMESDAIAEYTGATQSAGGGQPVNNMQPYLGVYYIIAITGIFPSRD